MKRSEKQAEPQSSTAFSANARKALEWLDELLLLQDVFGDEVGEAFSRLLRWLAKKEESDGAKGYRRYGKLWKAVLSTQEFIHHPRVGTFLQDYWLERFLENDNPFHRKAEMASLSKISPSLTETYRREVEIFQKLIRVDWEAEYLKKAGLLGKASAPSLEGSNEIERESELSPSAKARRDIKKKILSGGAKNAGLVTEISEYFSRNGWGLFGRYRAFRWHGHGDGKGKLTGIGAVDPIQLRNLVGYDELRQPLIDNIEAFVAGKWANNVLLYGERGTGKSSTVKALLNAYQDRGLRIIEVATSDLKDFHDILPFVRGRREKFILFVDDLSFEENETSYKGLKAVLEGTVEAPPQNVILIATSNRRHLVREFFGDRMEGKQNDGEIHGQDTIEEKLSLSDRFGLVVSFYTPDQEIYLKIVDSWAKAEGIKMPPQELHPQALRWAQFNNGRSGRTARQFIVDLKGKV